MAKNAGENQHQHNLDNASTRLSVAPSAATLTDLRYKAKTDRAQLDKAWLEELISEYASKNHGEAIAEAFATMTLAADIASHVERDLYRMLVGKGSR